MNWLIPTPHPLPGSTPRGKPTTRKERAEGVKFNKAEQFEKCRKVQQAFHRNKRTVSKAKVLDVVVSTNGGMYAVEVAEQTGLNIDYARRFLHELAKEGIVECIKMGRCQQGTMPSIWKLKK